MSILNMVQKIKISMNIEEVNELLANRWLLLDTYRQCDHDTFLLGLVSPDAYMRVQK